MTPYKPRIHIGGRWWEKVVVFTIYAVVFEKVFLFMQFRGRDKTSVDAKGRTILPARFRELLEETYPAKVARSLVVIPWFDGNLRVFPLAVWEEKQSFFESQFQAHDVFAIDEADSDLRRFLYGSAIDVQVDPQGRVLLSQDLRDHAGIEREVFWVAMGSMLEIWEPSRLHARFEGARASSLRASLQSRLRPSKDSQ